MDDRTRTEIEAAAFRALRAHLIEARPDVQNIDLMTLAGFCRNCLSRWMQEAAAERGIALSKEEAREMFYGMPYAEWTARYQREATPEQKAAFARALHESGGHGTGGEGDGAGGQPPR
ncbi:Uncharacterized protein putative in bacteria [Rubellimicrobium thermophilum DSM 16684]|uniref:Uncharacterized protein putative in bacteria n=1 Tax=Rubellimicrobium thermophilum DSM 16684 TaxID=1123069 RepID=S9QZT8_9RHOB|nr:DUF1244 domain-containing protein [Rubellimicrobium thermophilum]EPX85198.1 Uncharacterized protein putative in bacteria [Rubellimicrobium thermophilum DSM 16684]